MKPEIQDVWSVNPVKLPSLDPSETPAAPDAAYQQLQDMLERGGLLASQRKDLPAGWLEGPSLRFK